MNINDVRYKDTKEFKRGGHAEYIKNDPTYFFWAENYGHILTSRTIHCLTNSYMRSIDDLEKINVYEFVRDTSNAGKNTVRDLLELKEAVGLSVDEPPENRGINIRLKPGSVIQIVDEKHPWYPCLLVVTESEKRGCKAYAFIPNQPYSTVPIYLERETYLKVGDVKVKEGT